MELASIETLDELTAVRKMCMAADADEFSNYVFVGGMSINKNETNEDWYWLTGEKVSYPVPWTQGEPNFGSNDEFCLSLYKKDFLYNDVACSGLDKKFICQKRHPCACAASVSSDEF